MIRRALAILTYPSRRRGVVSRVETGRMRSVSLTQPMVAISDRVENRLPKMLTDSLQLSILSHYRHHQGSAYTERRYVCLTLDGGSDELGWEVTCRLLRLPGKRLTELPAPDREMWERVREDDE